MSAALRKRARRRGATHDALRPFDSYACELLRGLAELVGAALYVVAQCDDAEEVCARLHGLLRVERGGVLEHLIACEAVDSVAELYERALQLLFRVRDLLLIVRLLLVLGRRRHQVRLEPDGAPVDLLCAPGNLFEVERLLCGEVVNHVVAQELYALEVLLG